MDLTQFRQFAEQGYNRIPVWRSVLADLDTPLSVYLKLADGKNNFLLESVQGGEMWGRYSIIGLPCSRRFEYKHGRWRVYELDELICDDETNDPLTMVEMVMHQINAAPVAELPRLNGGLVGYFGYETMATIEPCLEHMLQLPDALGVPDICLLCADELAVFDNLQGRLYLIVNVEPKAEDGSTAGEDYAQAQRRLDQLQHRLRCGSPGYAQAARSYQLGEVSYGFAEADFKQAVARCQDYIAAGDCMQVVLSQRMSMPVGMPALDIYRALRALNPSPYMYHMDFGDFQVIGSSPEVLVRVHDQRAMLRPLAGTRPRGHDSAEDQRLADELLADDKERAEHLMLIDLGRNDLGRVAVTGSVNVTEQMAIELYSHVMHIVSAVECELDESYSTLDALRACFPAGTLSGAPKLRAMEIIAELEPMQRNIYAGTVGWLNWHGDADLAIAIRTGVLQDHTLHLQAGAGIVADSDAQLEWQETMNKGRAMISAITQAAQGL
jgi:anthranilate synthase component I